MTAPRKPTRWEQLEDYLFDYDKDGTDFSVTEYAAARNLEVSTASRHIEAYLEAQRRSDSRTLYVLHRKAGTRGTSARWLVGVRVKDARQIGAAFYDDVATRVKRALAPDLRRIAEINPRAAKVAEDQISQAIDGAIKVLELAAQGALVAAE